MRRGTKETGGLVRNGTSEMGDYRHYPMCGSQQPDWDDILWVAYKKKWEIKVAVVERKDGTPSMDVVINVRESDHRWVCPVCGKPMIQLLSIYFFCRWPRMLQTRPWQVVRVSCDGLQVGWCSVCLPLAVSFIGMGIWIITAFTMTINDVLNSTPLPNPHLGSGGSFKLIFIPVLLYQSSSGMQEPGNWLWPTTDSLLNAADWMSRKLKAFLREAATKSCWRGIQSLPLQCIT